MKPPIKHLYIDASSGNWPSGVSYANFINKVSSIYCGGITVHTAFVLVKSDIGVESDVLREIKKVEGVEEAYALYGTYDILARVSSQSMEELKQIVTWRIRKLDGITATLTLMAQENEHSSSKTALSAVPVTA